MSPGYQRTRLCLHPLRTVIARHGHGSGRCEDVSRPASIIDARMHMTIQPSDRTESTTWRWRQAMLLGCLLFVAWRGAAGIASTQPSPGAEANQLHAAIVNGDVESLRYWLEARHTDPSSANASEPD